MKKKPTLKIVLNEAKEEIFNTLPKDVADKLNKVVMGYCAVEKISSDNFFYGSEIVSVKKAGKSIGNKFSDQYNFRLKHILYRIDHKPCEMYHMVVQYTPGKHFIVTEQNKEVREETTGTSRYNH